MNYHPYSNPSSFSNNWDLFNDMRHHHSGGPGDFHSGPASMYPSWPFFRAEDISLDTGDMPGKQERVMEASYYASMPGAIRGQVPIIFYPSCSKEAHFQPAVVSYCTSYHSNYGRSMKDTPDEGNKLGDIPSAFLHKPSSKTMGEEKKKK